MRLKTLPLAILLTALLTLTGYAQTPPESPSWQSNAYGIDPGQFYPGSLLLELTEAAEAEIDAAVAEAYEAGYKAAMLRFAPELAAQRAAAEAAQRELDALRKKQNCFWPAVGISAGLSFITGFFLCSLTLR